jgi:hypothetical protein
MTNDETTTSNDVDSSRETPLTPTVSSRSPDSEVSRRSVLRATTAATATVVGISGAATAATQQTTFELGGEVSGWQGQSPSSIEGETNPTLALTAGTEYEVIWENLDGAPHNFVIVNANGDTLVQSEIVSEQGATQTVTFTASEEMTEYFCQPHSQSMRGTTNISTGTEDTATPTETDTQTETETQTETISTETDTQTEGDASQTATPTESATPNETAAPTPDESTNETSDGPLMADEACPANGSRSQNDTCARDDRTPDSESNNAQFDQLLRLLLRLIRQLIRGG